MLAAAPWFQRIKLDLHRHVDHHPDLPVHRRDMEILHLGEYPEPFWRTGGVSAAAWSGRLPNSFALLARRAQ